MNKKVIILTVFIILGMVIVPTIYKVYNTHQIHLKEVVEKEFLFQAKSCYNDSKCLNSKITLKDLYNNNYIEEKLSDPKTKEYYSENSYINLETLEINLIK